METRTCSHFFWGVRDGWEDAAWTAIKQLQNETLSQSWQENSEITAMKCSSLIFWQRFCAETQIETPQIPEKCVTRTCFKLRRLKLTHRGSADTHFSRPDLPNIPWTFDLRVADPEVRLSFSSWKKESAGPSGHESQLHQMETCVSQPWPCMFSMFPCSSTPDSNEWVRFLSSAEGWGRPIHLNQVCWNRETWKTCRAVCLEDQEQYPVCSIPQQANHILMSKPNYKHTKRAGKEKKMLWIF